MVDLFLRTTSQGLQAFLPIAFALAALRRHGRADARSGIGWGVGAALVASVPAGLIFQHSLRQSLWEAILALLAIGSMAWLLRRGDRARRMSPLVAAALTVLFVVRQTMEIAAVFVVAAFDLRSLEAVTAISSAVLLASAIGALWIWIERRFSPGAASLSTQVFLILFLSQLGMYAFHESAEARVLPWSDALHTATEPYGPDGVYGRHFSWLLVAAPLLVVAAARRRRQSQPHTVRAVRLRRYTIAACVLLVAIAGGLSLRSAGPPAAPRDGGVPAMAAAPHVLFRHTLADQDYGKLAIASLTDPANRRLSLGMPCERVAFARERGLCLQAIRGVFTTYRAVLFDRQFNTVASWAIAGSPSRTRVAPDGRVGVLTVFVTGHGYGSSFSTKTTLIDTASGDPLGDLEQFATWRDGTRVKAQDANFWGVTFGRDSNRFYATMGTGGKTYLVRGELGLRKLTVLYEGLECPSLSPDERTIAFKKRTGTAAGSWRLALLNLTTMTEHLLASESRNIDDQVEWLDDGRLLYAVARPNSAVSDVWVASTTGDTPPRVFIPAAESPAVVGPAAGTDSHPNQ